MEDNSPDHLATKYQKLASEYSKMRAQIIVLKKAVIEEQSKNTDLRESVKEKDQSVRKLEQEVESLNFRNQQLAKRIGVLQDELSANDVNHVSGKKSRSKQSTPTHPPNNSTDNNVIVDVLNTELKNKIAENEKLHMQLQSIEMEHQNRIDEMQHQIELIKSETDARQKSIKESVESQQVLIMKLSQEKEKLESKLSQEKETLESKLHSTQKELKEALLLVDTLETEARSLRVKVQIIEDSKKNNHNLFDDNKLTKEHWMLEAQLMQVKYERERKKVQELESKIQSLGGIFSQQNSIQTQASTPSGSQRSIEMTCTDFGGSSLQSPVSEDKISLNSSTAADDEVPQVTSYLRNRIIHLIDKMHTSDSKAVAFHTECVSLQQRLSLVDKEKKQLEEKLVVKNQMIQDLKEELATNVSNYESQLSLMSEHLANMNEKLSTQTEEIDALKSMQNSNHKISGRKSRNK